MIVKQSLFDYDIRPHWLRLLALLYKHVLYYKVGTRSVITCLNIEDRWQWWAFSMSIQPTSVFVTGRHSFKSTCYRPVKVLGGTLGVTVAERWWCKFLGSFPLCLLNNVTAPDLCQCIMSVNHRWPKNLFGCVCVIINIGNRMWHWHFLILPPPHILPSPPGLVQLTSKTNRALEMPD